MKKAILLFSLIALSLSLRAQPRSVNLHEIKNTFLVKILCNIDTIIKKGDDNIGVSIYKVWNGYGSAHLPETDEVSVKFLVSTIEPDDAPEFHLFNLGDFLTPEILKFEQLSKGSYIIEIEYGIKNNRKKSRFKIELRKIALLN